uniref:Uncharacterized protein n=1 Tax=Arcella intermedia TaxID=1963864 RepID=A0A6B2LKT6_9EUKA
MVVLGAAAVGKSCFVIRWYSSNFVEDYDPTLQDSYRKNIRVDYEDYVLDVYDTAGVDDYQLVRDKFIQIGEGFILMYSITSEDSYREIPNIFNRIESINDGKLPILLVGNKCDLDGPLRQVKKAEAQLTAETHGWGFFEASAKSDDNVYESIQSIVRSVVAYRRLHTPAPVKPKKKCVIL